MGSPPELIRATLSTSYDEFVESCLGTAGRSFSESGRYDRSPGG